MRRIVLFALAAALLLSTAVYAHHSYGATYDVSKQVKLEGKVVQFVFRNPHSFVHVEGPDANGQMQRWAVEWAGGAQLTGSSIDRNTLKVGDPVIISGNPTRTAGEHRLRMVSFKRTSDGLSWGNRQGEVVD